MKVFTPPSYIINDISKIDEIFKSHLYSSSNLLNIVTKYILKTKGKQIRPTLVFLSARLFGEVNQSAYSAAYMIELMHTATLLHDDVVDNAMKRRSFFSINALWKNKIAVLVGDFFLSKGLLYAIENKEFEMLEVISKAVKEMSEGELLQMRKSHSFDNTEELYFDIIYKKTASLFVAAMQTGALSHKTITPEELETITQIAKNIGLAFQIKDDVLDYAPTSIWGKPAYTDIKEKKVTLPLIYAIENSSESEKKWLIKAIKNHGNSYDSLAKIADFVKAKQGLQQSELKIKECCSQAIDLCKNFQNQEVASVMVELITYIQEREK